MTFFGSLDLQGLAKVVTNYEYDKLVEPQLKYNPMWVKFEHLTQKPILKNKTLGLYWSGYGSCCLLAGRLLQRPGENFPNEQNNDQNSSHTSFLLLCYTYRIYRLLWGYYKLEKQTGLWRRRQ